MSNSYSQLYVMLVFSPNNHRPLIRTEFEKPLYKYIESICSNKGQRVLAVNGTADHIHVLINLQRDYRVSDIARDIKANSSRFINERDWINGRFRWQRGYAAFTYSHSQIPAVVRYILRQKQHHAKKSFQSEYQTLLESFGIKYDEKYL